MKKTLFIIVLFSSLQIQAQKLPEQSIKAGTGIGLQIGPYSSTGLMAQLGYQRTIINNKWKLNPNFNYYSYSSFFPIGAQPLDVKSYALEVNLFYDINVSTGAQLFLGIGAFTSLLEGRVTKSDPDEPGYKELNESISEYYAGGVLSGGLRLGKPGGRTMWTIVPFSLYVGTKNYLELYLLKFQFDIKL